MGCVSVTRRFFDDNKIDRSRIANALLYCRHKLEPFQTRFRSTAWQRAIGCSGSIKSISSALEQLNGHPAITRAGVAQLLDLCIEAGGIEQLNIAGVSDDRLPIFIGGLVVLSATMNALNIETLEASPWALREGLLFDLLGHDSIADMKERSVTDLALRFHADAIHAQRTEKVALELWRQVEPANSSDESWSKNLTWACMLHEVGLDINHDSYHKHSGYIVENCHLPGFGHDEQRVLAKLVHYHRKKLDWDDIESLQADYSEQFLLVLLILRLAVILTRARNDIQDISWSLSFNAQTIQFCAAEAWWQEQTLAISDLEAEVKYLKKSPISLHLVRPELAD